MIKNNVLIGKYDWLFLYQREQQFDFLLGDKKVEDLSIKNFHDNIINRAKYCGEKNIKYKYVLFPSKLLLKQLEFN